MRAFNSLLAFAALLGLTVGHVRAADEPTKDDIAKAEIRATAVSDLALAGELAAFARDAKSPESLVIAGGMLIRANKTFGGKMDELDAKPTDGKGNVVKSDAVASPSLEKQAESYFDEARAMVATDKTRSTALEALIGNSKKFGWDGSSERRAAVGGPKTITRTLLPGETHTYPVAFFSGVPAAVAMNSSGPPKIQFDINHVGGNNLFSLKGQVANYTWTPARDANNIRRFTITLTNLGQRPTTYTLTTN